MQEGGLGLRLEIAVLVEHLVVGELSLAVDSGNDSPRNEGSRVVDPRAGVLGKADDDARVLHFLAHALQTHLDLAPKPAMEQQILGWIARQGELREKHQVSTVLRARPT